LGKVYDGIGPELAEWIGAQKLFFVATAPSGREGHVNCSPRGGDTLRVLGPREVAWLDGAGSGVETLAHLRDNGRLCVMFCAFEGAPRILRLHGRGEIIDGAQPRFAELLPRFARWPSARAIVHVTVTRVSDSCGYGVPFYDYRGERRESQNYVAKASDRTLKDYLQDHNRRSIDGLPGLEPAQIEATVIQR
jgi:predicted pyridoxine 5'-phosphate oxidase superfamily flavin-nucleotide-binding protein